MQAPEVLGGRYEVRGVLGRGGMAKVCDGWDTRLHRPVAVKLLHPALNAHPAHRRRLQAEACAAAALNHPHIVAVHDSGDHRGTPFIVMERLPGPTLADAIARGPLPPDRVRALLDELLSALAAAHGAGILHRDIKPGNILFTDFGDIKVGDFGIAKSAGTAAATVTGEVIGTMAYLTAERVAGHPATVTDDLYSIGVVGYEALTGRHPYPQQDQAALARAIATEAPVPLATLCPAADPVLVATIERAMARDPRRRFTSAGHMRAALAGRIDPHADTPIDTLIVPAAARRPPRRTRPVVGVAAVAVAVAVAAIAVLVDAARPPESAGPDHPPISSPAATVSLPPVAPSEALRMPAAKEIRRQRPAQPGIGQTPERKNGRGG